MTNSKYQNFSSLLLFLFFSVFAFKLSKNNFVNTKSNFPVEDNDKNDETMSRNLYNNFDITRNITLEKDLIFTNLTFSIIAPVNISDNMEISKGILPYKAKLLQNMNFNNPYHLKLLQQYGDNFILNVGGNRLTNENQYICQKINGNMSMFNMEIKDINIFNSFIEKLNKLNLDSITNKFDDRNNKYSTNLAVYGDNRDENLQQFKDFKDYEKLKDYLDFKQFLKFKEIEGFKKYNRSEKNLIEEFDEFQKYKRIKEFEIFKEFLKINELSYSIDKKSLSVNDNFKPFNFNFSDDYKNNTKVPLNKADYNDFGFIRKSLNNIAIWSIGIAFQLINAYDYISLFVSFIILSFFFVTVILALISYFIENRNLKRRLAELKEREENFLYFYTLKSLPTDNIPPNSLITNNNHIGIILDRKYSEKSKSSKNTEKTKKTDIIDDNHLYNNKNEVSISNKNPSFVMEPKIVRITEKQVEFKETHKKTKKVYNKVINKDLNVSSSSDSKDDSIKNNSIDNKSCKGPTINLLGEINSNMDFKKINCDLQIDEKNIFTPKYYKKIKHETKFSEGMLKENSYFKSRKSSSNSNIIKIYEENKKRPSSLNIDNNQNSSNQLVMKYVEDNRVNNFLII